MTKANLKWTTALTGTAIALLLLWRGSEAFAPKALAQLPAAAAAEGFEASEYYPEPNYTQLMWSITAKNFRSQSGGKVLLSGMNIEVFQTNGPRAFTVSAPECVYDRAAGMASSTGRLHFASGDGRLSVEGEGFAFRQKAKTLNISNRVHTVLRDVIANKTKP